MSKTNKHTKGSEYGARAHKRGEYRQKRDRIRKFRVAQERRWLAVKKAAAKLFGTGAQRIAAPQGARK